MNDLTILHLSDLHIDSSGPSYSRLLKKLISDIANEIKHTKDKSLLLVVTGDIIHQGPEFSKSPNAFNNAVNFFSDLYQILKTKVVGIYIVPGNHDKRRTEDNRFLVPAYRAMPTTIADKNGKKRNAFDENFYNNFWKFHLESYDTTHGTGYIELTKKIYQIFGLSVDECESKSFISDTFGVDVIEVLGKKYCFILLNTAWSCFDEDDTRNMILGDFQIQRIKKQFQDLVGKYREVDRPDITFILGHHPVEALRGTEQDHIFNEMISFDSFDANVYLCGHTHDRTVINWINNRHSINTFVTGIGWPENSGGSHVGNHTYSMYVFNLDANSIDVYVRSTNDGGSFSPDFRIYTTEQNTESQKLVFPIKAQNAQTYIPLSLGDNRSSKAYYISEQFVKTIKEYVKRIERLRSISSSMMESDKNDLFLSLCNDEEDNELEGEFTGINPTDEYITEELAEDDELLYNYFFANIPNESEEFINEIKRIFRKNANVVYETFLGFLQKLCQKMQKILVEDLCDETDIVRFHFRFLADRKSLQYLKLCASFPEQINSSEFDVSEIKYGQLIEKAFQSGHSLIYSVNEEFTESKLSEKWKNFITVVPLFDKNSFTRKNTNINKKIPFITFGVTINNDKFDDLLYCMDYFSIKETLEEIIEQYLELFCINIGDFCIWAKRYLEQGEPTSEHRHEN
ncbi:MAG: metallophosphoesterase [Eubacterium sp.]|nr:metallophosphoesterase [Eubacterium sp.]